MIDQEIFTSLAERHEAGQPRCPACGRINDVEARICACGFWFERQVMLQPTSKDAPAKPARSGTRTKSVLSAAAVLIAAASIIAAWTGIVTRMWHTNSESEFAISPSDDRNASDPASAVTNSAPKNLVDGQVTAVLSGDVVTIRDASNNEHQIRLTGIDVTKIDGDDPKNALSALVLGRAVHVVLQKMDGDDLAGKLLLDGVNVNLELIRKGYARHDKYSDLQTDADRQLFENAEIAAKKDRLGIWTNETEPAIQEAPAVATADRPTSEPIPAAADPLKVDVLSAAANNANIKEQPEPLVAEKPAAPQVEPPPPAQALKSTPAVNAAVTTANKTATARCNDGSLSYRSSRTGSCSGNGGVAEWLSGSGSPGPNDTGDRKYMLGSRGGCYYIRPSGSKTYVDKKLCAQ